MIETDTINRYNQVHINDKTIYCYCWLTCDLSHSKNIWRAAIKPEPSDLDTHSEHTNINSLISEKTTYTKILRSQVADLSLSVRWPWMIRKKASGHFSGGSSVISLVPIDLASLTFQRPHGLARPVAIKFSTITCVGGARFQVSDTPIKSGAGLQSQNFLELPTCVHTAW